MFFADGFKVYDYILTFEDERRLVWSSRFTFMKAIFFVNRYLVFVGTVGMLYGESMHLSYRSDAFEIHHA